MIPDAFTMTSPRNTDRGFTLVETLVAITILVMAVTAPLTLGSQGLTVSRIARDQVIATYLIQDAIEYVRNARDNNILASNDWLTGLSDCTTGTCRIDVPADTIAPCGGGGCPVLNFDPSSGLYGYTGTSTGNWEGTKFTRTVSIQQTVVGVEARIVVSVAWKDGLIARTVSADEYLLNWQ
jgi:prepilin-type N-terminal cleavage/methylation domain-containing protein